MKLWQFLILTSQIVIVSIQVAVATCAVSNKANKTVGAALKCVTGDGRYLCECKPETVSKDWGPPNYPPTEDHQSGVIPSAGTAGLPTQKPNDLIGPTVVRSTGDNLTLRPGKPWTFDGYAIGGSSGFIMPADIGDQYAKRDRSKPLVIPLRDVSDSRVVGRIVFDAKVYEVRE